MAYNFCKYRYLLIVWFLNYGTAAFAARRLNSRDTYLLLSDGGTIRPFDFRIWTSFTCRANLCTLGKGGTAFFVRPQPRHTHWNSTSERNEKKSNVTNLWTVEFSGIQNILIQISCCPIQVKKSHELLHWKASWVRNSQNQDCHAVKFSPQIWIICQVQLQLKFYKFCMHCFCSSIHQNSENKDIASIVV